MNADIEGEECHYNYLDSETSNGGWRCGGGGNLSLFVKFSKSRLYRREGFQESYQ